MARWENAWGEEFETEEEARDDVLEKMEWSDFEEELQYSINWHTLFEYARKHDDFFETFENEFCEAENEFFEHNYYKVEEGD